VITRWSATSIFTRLPKGSGGDHGVSGGLRVAGRKPDEIPAANANPAAAVAARSETADHGGQKSASFESTIAERLKGSKTGDPRLAGRLAAAFEQAAALVEKDFGAGAREKFQNAILDADGSEEGLAEAVGLFARELLAKNPADQLLESKIAKLAESFNLGLEVEEGTLSNSETLAAAGLSAFLNAFFHKGASPGEEASDSGLKFFNDALEWIRGVPGENQKEEPRAASGSPSGPVQRDGFYRLCFEGVGEARAGNFHLPEEAALGAAEYLEERLENHGAAEALLSDFRSSPGQAFAKAIAIVSKENGKKAALDFVGYLNSNVAPNVSAGDGVFCGWNIGSDFSKTYYEGRDDFVGSPTAGPISGGSLDGYWFGDSDMEPILMRKGHQGVTTNTYFKNENGALAVAKGYDLDELYLGWKASPGGLKEVDLCL
jgi:hypothetical protein